MKCRTIPSGIAALALLALRYVPVSSETALTYPIVGTGITRFYDDQGAIPAPQPGAAFYGQDAHYQNNQPSYTESSQRLCQSKQRRLSRE